MRIRITRVDDTLPLPRYETTGAVAFDLAPRIDATIAPGEIAILPANCIIEVPPGHALILAGRSSLAKRGLVLANGIGVIDQDYRGPNDEIHLALRNVTDAPLTVHRGDRLAQGMILPVAQAEWEEVPRDAITAVTRGGFGSTGN